MNGAILYVQHPDRSNEPMPFDEFFSAADNKDEKLFLKSADGLW